LIQIDIIGSEGGDYDHPGRYVNAELRQNGSLCGVLVHFLIRAGTAIDHADGLIFVLWFTSITPKNGVAAR